MLIEQTLQKLYDLKLSGMANILKEKLNRPDHKDLTHEEFIGLLIDAEWIDRQNKKLGRFLKDAHLKMPSACLEDIDYQHPRGLLKTKLLNLQNQGWLEQHQNILITGPTGLGKSYLACAFGQWACRQGHTTLYYRWPRLLGDMLAARGEGNYLKHLRKLAKVKLLIIDDFGMNALSELEQKDFMEVIEDRYMTSSTIITSQLPTKDWHEYIGEPTLADAICDRLFHVAHIFELKGGSMRKQPPKLD
jgi:DNA replication protein DnaC